MTFYLATDATKWIQTLDCFRMFQMEKLQQTLGSNGNSYIRLSIQTPDQHTWNKPAKFTHYLNPLMVCISSPEDWIGTLDILANIS